MARYIEICDRLKDTPDGPEYDRIADELDVLYEGMGVPEIEAIEAHYAAKKAAG